MLIKVLRAREDSWYSEFIGQQFYVFHIPSSNAFLFHATLFFFPQDVEIVQGGNGFITEICRTGIA